MRIFFEQHHTKRSNQTISNITFLCRTNSNDFHWHMNHVQQSSQQFTTTLCNTLGVGTFTPYSTTPSVRSNHRLAMRISLMYFGSSSESDGLRVVFLLSARSRSNSSVRPILLILSSWPFNSNDKVPSLKELCPAAPGEDDDRYECRPCRPTVDVAAGGEFNSADRDKASWARVITDW